MTDRNMACARLVLLGILAVAVWPFEAAADSPLQERADKLHIDQAKVADQYDRFKKNITDLADFLRQTDPERAEVLEKAVAQMNRGDTVERFKTIVGVLGQDALLIADLDDVLASQESLETELQALLTLLLTENRQSENQSEKQRIARYLKEINRMIRAQKGIYAQTDRISHPEDLAPRQSKLGKQCQGLVEKMQAAGEKTNPPASGKSGEEEPGPGENPTEKDPTEKSPEGVEGNKPPQEKAPGSPGEKQGQSGEKQSGEKQQSGKLTPQQAVEQAQQKMQAAAKRLAEAKKEEAVEKQQEAIAALEKAKAELARILRQLREEEIERVLALLEARFQKILRLQKKVYEQTIVLDQTPQEDRDRRFEIESSRLGEKESKIVALVDATLILFRNEGSAVALPEASLQLREDMEMVMVRLDQAETGSITQQLMEDIIESLEEILAAIERSQENQQQRQQAGQAGGSGDAEQPLVDMLAELKMIRSLQWRVNRRTAMYQEVLLAGRSPREKLMPELRKLADRQARIERIARDIVLENNR